MEISEVFHRRPFSLQSGKDNRTQNELLTFSIIQTFLLIVRLLTLIFFTVQTLRYVRVSQRKSGRTNRYTLGTFICLNLSFLGFFVYDGLNIVISFARYVADEEEKKVIEKWEQDSEYERFVFSKVVRHVSYCMQNSAFILNIFSFLHKKRYIRNTSLILDALKSAIFIALELSLENVTNENY